MNVSLRARSFSVSVLSSTGSLITFWLEIAHETFLHSFLCVCVWKGRKNGGAQRQRRCKRAERARKIISAQLWFKSLLQPLISFGLIIDQIHQEKVYWRGREISEQGPRTSIWSARGQLSSEGAKAEKVSPTVPSRDLLAK